MVTMENYEEYLLLHADGELSEAEEQALEAFMQEHPGLRHEMEQYMATKLLPDMEMVYTGKDALLKEPTKVVALGQWKMYAAAACVVILAAAGIWKWSQPDTTQINIVQVNHNTINIAAPKDTITRELKVQANDVAGTKQVVRTPKNPSPSLQIHPKTRHYETPDLNRAMVKDELATIKGLAPRPLNTQPLTDERMPARMGADLPTMQTAVAAPVENSNETLLARLPIKQEGLSGIANAVNDKIEKVRNLKENIKNTDLSVRLGNRELFVVKL